MFEILPVILKCLSFDWVLIYRKFCFPDLGLVSPGLSFDVVRVSFSGIGRRVPGVQFPSPIKAWDVQLPGGDVNRPRWERGWFSVMLAVTANRPQGGGGGNGGFGGVIVP